MSPRLQIKLLRVLQERQLEPVGSSRTITVDVRIVAKTEIRTITVDVRIVAATGKDLKTEIREGRFRHDLYYRLNVIPIHSPPLRERREDIPLLVDHFLEKYNREANRHVTRVPREVLDVLLAYSWPGNVRELENCIERAVVMSHDNGISLDLLPEEVRKNRPDECILPASSDSEDPQALLQQAVIRMLGSRNEPTGIRDAILALAEETVLRYRGFGAIQPARTGGSSFHQPGNPEKETEPLRYLVA